MEEGSSSLAILGKHAWKHHKEDRLKSSPSTKRLSWFFSQLQTSGKIWLLVHCLSSSQGGLLVITTKIRTWLLIRSTQLVNVIRLISSSLHLQSLLRTPPSSPPRHWTLLPSQSCSLQRTSKIHSVCTWYPWEAEQVHSCGVTLSLPPASEEFGFMVPNARSSHSADVQSSHF